MTTKIEWTDETCNVVAGCTAVDAGCTNCYAASTANLHVQHFDGLARRTGDGRSVWTGKLRYRPDMAERLLRTRKPRRVFWCSMGDLFHEDVPDEWLDHAFAVMALTPWLLHQVLTRRVDRLADYLSAPDLLSRLEALSRHHPELHIWQTEDSRAGLSLVRRRRETGRDPLLSDGTQGWPLPNVVAMTSVIDQQTADERLPHLLRCPARWRSVSYEPALGAVSWRWASWDGWRDGNGKLRQKVDHLDGLRLLDQVIAGGESGPGARPPHPQWFRDTRDACDEAGVAFFFKQWGEWLAIDQMQLEQLDTLDLDRLHDQNRVDIVTHPLLTHCKIGKRRAGRRLDRREHNGEPWEWRDGAWRDKA